MPLPARYILSTAKILMEQHGEGAPYVAAVMLDELQCKGDLGGVEDWEYVMTALRQLQASGSGLLEEQA